MSAGRTTTAVLLSILLLAALLRLLGLDHGLPHVVGADEGFEVHRALSLGAGEFNLERAGKGGFFYLLFVEYGLYFVWLSLVGKVGSTTDFARGFVQDPTPFWMIGRLTVALLGVLSVYWTYRIGRRMYGERTALFGAVVLAVSTLHVSHSQYIGVDIPMTLLLLVVLGLAHDWSDPQRRARPVLLGIAFGFAVMNKIVAIVAGVPIALANWLRHGGGSLASRLASREILLVYAVAALVFMAGNPGFVVHLGDFTSEVVSDFFGVGAEVDSPGGSRTARPNLWLYYGRVLNADLGFALWGLCLAGAALALLRRRPADLLLAATAAAFYVLIAGAQTSHLFYPRYAIPLIPPLALLAGRLLDRVVRRLPVSDRRGGWILAGATILLLLPLALGSWSWSLRQTREDSRVAARAWFERHAEPGSAVFLVGNPVVDTAPNLTLPLRNTDANLDALIAELRTAEPIKARTLEWRKQKPGVAFDLRTVRHFEPNRSLDQYLAEGVRYLVLDENHFGSARLARDRKHATEVLASRARLAAACRADPRLERVFAIDPASEGLTGPAIEVYGLRPEA